MNKKELIECIRDDDGDLWYPRRDAHVIRWHKKGTLEELHDYLVADGHITPDPLEKALESLNAGLSFPPEKNQLTITKLKADEIIRTLYEEMK